MIELDSGARIGDSDHASESLHGILKIRLVLERGVDIFGHGLRILGVTRASVWVVIIRLLVVLEEIFSY